MNVSNNYPGCVKKKDFNSTIMQIPDQIPYYFSK